MYIKSNFIETHKFKDKFKEFENINFSFFFDYIPTQEELLLNPINIFAHDEPNEYFGHHDWIEKNSQWFSLILTWNERLLKKYNNSRLLIYGEAWVDNEEEEINKDHEKKFEISFIRGNKLQSTGHLLRHQIFNKRDEIIIPNNFMASTDTSTSESLTWSKINAHKNSMYSLIIENTNHHNYFTEKITDCILMKSIPVYWGCTNIEKFYNLDGIIQIYSDDDAIEKINKLTPEFYKNKIDVINENWEKAHGYRNYIDRMVDILKETFILNNLL